MAGRSLWQTRLACLVASTTPASTPVPGITSTHSREQDEERSSVAKTLTSFPSPSPVCVCVYVSFSCYSQVDGLIYVAAEGKVSRVLRVHPPCTVLLPPSYPLPLASQSGSCCCCGKLWSTFGVSKAISALM